MRKQYLLFAIFALIAVMNVDGAGKSATGAPYGAGVRHIDIIFHHGRGAPQHRPITVDLNDTVADLKRTIEKVYKIPFADQRILDKGGDNDAQLLRNLSSIVSSGEIGVESMGLREKTELQIALEKSVAKAPAPEVQKENPMLKLLREDLGLPDGTDFHGIRTAMLQMRDDLDAIRKQFELPTAEQATKEPAKKIIPAKREDILKKIRALQNDAVIYKAQLEEWQAGGGQG